MPLSQDERKDGPRFLTLPTEIRLMIYNYLLPTPQNPEILMYNPTVEPRGQPFLALWRTCKTIYLELPKISTLLSADAIIPALELHHEDIGDRWEESLAYITPYLCPAKSLRLYWERFDQKTGSFRDHSEAEEARPYKDWFSFAMKEWSCSEVVAIAFHTWLSKSDARTKRLLIYKIEMGYSPALPLVYRMDKSLMPHLPMVVMVDPVTLKADRNGTEQNNPPLWDLIEMHEDFLEANIHLRVADFDKNTITGEIIIQNGCGHEYEVSRVIRHETELDEADEWIFNGLEVGDRISRH